MRVLLARRTRPKSLPGIHLERSGAVEWAYREGQVALSIRLSDGKYGGRDDEGESAGKTESTAGSREVDKYLAGLPPDAQAALQKLRKTIAGAAPGATEGFSYGVPAFRLEGRPIVAYGASRNIAACTP